MNLVEAIADLDRSSDLHAARILVLLRAFSEGTEGGPIEGITKLAKLDFLIRYPLMLERALIARGKSTRDVQLEDHERYSVESKMVRYRFGPWDHRYRDLLNVLAAKDLISLSIEGRTIVISLTSDGHRVSEALAQDPLFEATARRARTLKRNIDLSATNLMRFIYETFPEIVSLRTNKPIPA
ncbi:MULTISPECIES: ABC-three component system middle component 4 [unclassified Paraburkholderia]|uniref:ABC-three component system middle component 4 n=1 Tax=unclassified Paraburkholderia TaxID=2615204 RepID=UPI002AB307CE|nr:MULTISPECIES: ABC-three component system middle component 4 [unclassified Paraburkholderia]